MGMAIGSPASGLPHHLLISLRQESGLALWSPTPLWRWFSDRLVPNLHAQLRTPCAS